MKDASDELHEMKAAVFNMFKQCDINEDGYIDKEELLESYKSPQMKAFLEHIEVDAMEVNTLFHMLDPQGSGKVSIEGFIEGCFRMGRNAKSIDMMLMMQMQEDTYTNV